MNVDRAVLTLAGSTVLASLMLAWLVNPYWLLLTAFVGANLFQASFTGFCPAAIVFRKPDLHSNVRSKPHECQKSTGIMRECSRPKRASLPHPRDAPVRACAHPARARQRAPPSDSLPLVIEQGRV
jgi:hypothetical protein